jgi:hypothetical protein
MKHYILPFVFVFMIGCAPSPKNNATTEIQALLKRSIEFSKAENLDKMLTLIEPQRSKEIKAKLLEPKFRQKVLNGMEASVIYAQRALSLEISFENDDNRALIQVRPDHALTFVKHNGKWYFTN